MRRTIQVRGATMDSGNEFTENEEGVVAVYVHPDKSVSYKDNKGNETTIEGTWVSYTPRVL